MRHLPWPTSFSPGQRGVSSRERNFLQRTNKRRSERAMERSREEESLSMVSGSRGSFYCGVIQVEDPATWSRLTPVEPTRNRRGWSYYVRSQPYNPSFRCQVNCYHRCMTRGKEFNGETRSISPPSTSQPLTWSKF